MKMTSCMNNYNLIKDNMVSILKASDREDDSCTLIAVSKTKPLPLLKEVYDAGCRDFGENYVQELVDKVPAMPDDIRWHMIGHLQTNKVKYIIDKVYMIHSVDSYKLAEVISKEACKHNLTMRILLEVNVAGEVSKFGFTPDNIIENAINISKLPNIEICGLMTSAPYVENGEENSQYFVELKALLLDITTKLNDNNKCSVLSMGMTNDYETAIRCGSTYIRVGTAIFGERNYNK